MAPFYKSIEFKLSMSFLILILVIAGLTFSYTYQETRKAITTIVKEDLRQTAAYTTSMIDGDAVASLKPGDESTVTYRSIQNQLKQVRAAFPDIKYIYIMRQTSRGVEFVVDADYGDPDAPNIGELYTADIPQELIDGFTRPSVDSTYTTDAWGTVLSGYSPIMNKHGESVGLVGIDIDRTRIYQKEHFIGYTIFIIMGIAILLATLIIALFSMTMIRDVKKLNATADKISKGEMDFTVDVKRDDEIGELADSFSRMVASLKIMMLIKNDTQKKEVTQQAVANKKKRK